MDKCHSVQDMLADYRSGLLSAGKRGWVEAHCAECSECAKELRVLDDVLALVDSNTPMQEPPAGLWNGVANRIATPETGRRGAFGHWWTRPLRLAGVGVAALALVIAIEFGAVQHDSVVPVRMASGNEYVQGHALYAGQAPLADRVSYLSLVASNEVQSK
jgi:anti-sigma factor RsiW